MPRPIPPPRDSGFTTTTELPLYWVTYGPAGAPRLLLLHGGPGASHDYLLPQLLELAGAYELTLYDQRGGGRSRPPNNAPITWRTQVEDLARVIDELGLHPPSIVGYSWGAMLGMLYAIEAQRNPGLTAPERLVLIDPAPLTRQYRADFEAEFARRQASPVVQAMRDELAASGLKERDPAAYRQRLFELGVAGYFADPRAARELTPFRVTGRVQQSVWESLGDFDVIADLEGMRIPALITHGRQDPIPLASSQGAARAMGAPLEIIEACGHVPYVEQPDALFAAVHRFLRESATPARRP
ncbi:MAG TPA: alpha/beta hydrolase [Gemmatimonadaceae bacterium]|nr:alpha/beta hydrolase [Gemmatimonadaceae bacterium]